MKDRMKKEAISKTLVSILIFLVATSCCASKKTEVFRPMAESVGTFEKVNNSIIINTYKKELIGAKFHVYSAVERVDQGLDSELLLFNFKESSVFGNLEYLIKRSRYSKDRLVYAVMLNGVTAKGALQIPNESIFKYMIMERYYQNNRTSGQCYDFVFDYNSQNIEISEYHYKVYSFDESKGLFSENVNYEACIILYSDFDFKLLLYNEKKLIKSVTLSSNGLYETSFNTNKQVERYLDYEGDWGTVDFLKRIQILRDSIGQDELQNVKLNYVYKFGYKQNSNFELDSPIIKRIHDLWGAREFQVILREDVNADGQMEYFVGRKIGDRVFDSFVILDSRGELVFSIINNVIKSGDRSILNVKNFYSGNVKGFAIGYEIKSKEISSIFENNKAEIFIGELGVQFIDDDGYIIASVKSMNKYDYLPFFIFYNGKTRLISVKEDFFISESVSESVSRPKYIAKDFVKSPYKYHYDAGVSDKIRELIDLEYKYNDEVLAGTSRINVNHKLLLKSKDL